MKKIFWIIVLIFSVMAPLTSCGDLDEPPYYEDYYIPFNTLMYVEYPGRRVYIDDGVSIYYSGSYWTVSGAKQIGRGPVVRIYDDRIILDAYRIYNAGYTLTVSYYDGAILESIDPRGRRVYYTLVYRDEGFYYVKTNYDPIGW